MIGVGLGVVAKRRYSGFPPPLRSFWQRVRDDGGTMYDYNSAIAAYRLAPTASLVWAASASKEAVDYSVLPADGSGDFTYSGGGNAVSQRPDGLWQVGWAANTPRNSYLDGVLGRLVEPQRQMLILQPRSFAGAAWAKTNGVIEGDGSTAGVEKVVNGGFINSDNWTQTGGWVFNNGYVRFDASQTGTYLTQILTTNNLSLYVLKFSVIDGTARIYFTSGGSTGIFSQITSYTNFPVGDYTYYVYSLGATLFSLRGSNSGGAFSLTNISLKEVTAFPCPFVNNLGVNTNEGFKFTATANDAILRLTTAHTSIAASTYTNSVFLKRITGTGQVSILDVNNVARPITITNEWKRYEYAAAASGTSGQIGIQLATSGDEVMVCHAQAELGAASTSPIYGTEGGTRTREADDNRVDLPSGVTEVQLTNMSDTVTTDASPTDPYVMPLGTWKKIIMI